MGKKLDKLLKYSPLFESAGVLFIAGSVVLLTFQVYLQNKELILQNKTSKERAYAETLDKIIEMKNWAFHKDEIVDSIESNEVWFPNGDYAGYKTIDEYYKWTTLFYYIERIYHRGNSDLIGNHDRNGLLREARIWLDIPKAKTYFKKFGIPMASHSLSFIIFAADHYKIPLPPDYEKRYNE
jgi:hypothetical protein